MAVGAELRVRAAPAGEGRGGGAAPIWGRTGAVPR
jgi:hypothetical protein